MQLNAGQKARVVSASFPAVLKDQKSRPFSGPGVAVRTRRRRQDQASPSGQGVAVRTRSANFCVASLPTSEKLQQGVLTNNATKRPPIYRVMLHNDPFNKREYVVKVLIKVVQGMGVDGAIAAMQEAHETGVAMVQASPQDEAEQCCECLRLSGLSSSIEPGC